MSIRFLDGALPVLVDDDAGRIVLVDPPWGEHLILHGGLATGLGSSALPLDRGQPGRLRIVRIVRRGRVAHLESLARDLGAGGPALPGGATEPVERAAVDDAFARSVLATLPVLAGDAREEWTDALPLDRAHATLVDVTAFVSGDVFGFAAVLGSGARSPAGALPDAVPYLADAERSAIDPAATHVSEGGTVLGAVLSLTAQGRPPARVRVIVDEDRTITFEQRVVLRPLPSGASPLPYHPRSGSYGKVRVDPSRITDDRAVTVLQPRFRTDRPIVFSIDPAIPEPYRSAVLDGGGWWADAFAAAGLPGGFRTELREPGTDPWALDVNPVWWVHRAERGWSMGHAVTDPATGEILRGSVRLGSQRVAQLRALFEAIVAPYGAADEAERRAEIEAAIVARLRLLAAHEIGHALGFVHNYASTAHEATSVMDYPHPFVSLPDEGRPSLVDAYPNGLGPWDRYVVAHGYGAAEARDGVRTETELPFLTDADGHAPGASTVVAVPWVLPLGGALAGPLDALDHILRVRARAIAGFGVGVAPTDAQLGELENRFALLHLLHRFEVARVARLLGGAEYGYGLVGDAAAAGVAEAAGTTPVPAEEQRAAIGALASALTAEVLAVPREVARLLTPPSIRFETGAAVPEAGSRLGPVTDLESYEEVAAAVVATEALAVERLNRLEAARAVDPESPGVVEVVGALVAAAGTPAARDVLLRAVLAVQHSGRLTVAATDAVRSALTSLTPGPRLAPAVARALAGEPPLPADTALPVLPPGAPL